MCIDVYRNPVVMRVVFPLFFNDNKAQVSSFVTTCENPQSVHTTFVPATVLSRTSCTVFVWHFMQSLFTVSGFAILPVTVVCTATLTLRRKHEIRTAGQGNYHLCGGVAKPGQTRRTQDQMRIRHIIYSRNIHKSAG